MSNTLKKSLVMAFVGSLLMAGSALALPIVGSISMSGGWAPTGGSGIGDATGIAFIDGVVDGRLGDFTAIAHHTPVAMNDFTFSPLVLNNPLWSVGGFSFDLDAPVTLTFQNDVYLLLEGTGTFYRDGYDPTPAQWAFSGQELQGALSWSSSNASAAVPEPMTMLLMGTGLAGLMVIRRKKED